MKPKFYNRAQDLQDLAERHRTLSKGELIVIYGRRRVGKTEFIKEFLGRIDAASLYFYVDLMEKPQLLESLSREVAVQLGESVRFTEWSDFFAYINQKAAAKFVLVIDEFQRFLDVSPDFLTALQRHWDEKLRHRKILLFLVGSSLGMMQRVLESKAGALYGRVTGRIKLSPFTYAEFREAFPDLSEEDKVRFYSVFGGTPQYFLLAKQYQDIHQAIAGLVLTKGRELEDEPERILEYERVRARAKYNAILQSIAAGKATLKEMTEQTGIPQTTLPAYLARIDTLLDLVARRDPVL
ncbi:AAA family ATPase, partial [Candidatus Woesearchaeota archaeon]|nr:AAA family ATPase [Candidatus Woesearchaeota archaeon]